MPAQCLTRVSPFICVYGGFFTRGVCKRQCKSTDVLGVLAKELIFDKDYICLLLVDKVRYTDTIRVGCEVNSDE